MRTQLTNADIAELLAFESDETAPPAQRALRRAARRAFLWEEEATALINSRRSLTELSGVGPYIARLIQTWIKNPPKIAAPPPYFAKRRPVHTLLSGYSQSFLFETRLEMPSLR
jgi:hypothetical protein